MPHEFIKTVLTNFWVQLMVGSIGTIGAVVFRHKVTKFLRIFGTYFLNQGKLAKENLQLKEDLDDAAKRNKEWDAIVEDIEKRHQAVLRELEESKKDISKLKSLQRDKSNRINDLEVDVTQLRTWGRLLVGQLMAHGIIPELPEPQLLSAPLKKEN